MSFDSKSSMERATQAGRFSVEGPVKPFPRDWLPATHLELLEAHAGRLHRTHMVKAGWRYTYFHAKAVETLHGPMFCLDNPEIVIVAERVA